MGDIADEWENNALNEQDKVYVNLTKNAPVANWKDWSQDVLFKGVAFVQINDISEHCLDKQRVREIFDNAIQLYKAVPILGTDDMSVAFETARKITIKNFEDMKRGLGL